MFSFFKREVWALVKTVVTDGVAYEDKTGGLVSVYLFESNKGNRKIESICSFRGVPQETIDAYVKGSKYYHKTLHRWLNGRYDPEIPSYSEISEEDTANALRGKIE